MVSCGKYVINKCKSSKMLNPPRLAVCVTASSHAIVYAYLTGMAWDLQKRERLSTRWCTALAISKPGPPQVGKQLA